MTHKIYLYKPKLFIDFPFVISAAHPYTRPFLVAQVWLSWQQILAPSLAEDGRFPHAAVTAGNSSRDCVTPKFLLKI